MPRPRCVYLAAANATYVSMSLIGIKYSPSHQRNGQFLDLERTGLEDYEV